MLRNGFYTLWKHHQTGVMINTFSFCKCPSQKNSPRKKNQRVLSPQTAQLCFDSPCVAESLYMIFFTGWVPCTLGTKGTSVTHQMPYQQSITLLKIGGYVQQQRFVTMKPMLSHGGQVWCREKSAWCAPHSAPLVALANHQLLRLLSESIWLCWQGDDECASSLWYDVYFITGRKIWIRTSLWQTLAWPTTLNTCICSSCRIVGVRMDEQVPGSPPTQRGYSQGCSCKAMTSSWGRRGLTSPTSTVLFVSSIRKQLIQMVAHCICKNAPIASHEQDTCISITETWRPIVWSPLARSVHLRPSFATTTVALPPYSRLLHCSKLLKIDFCLC